ncbi:MAG TPA: ATP-binding cassette domain-containing protein [Terriglobales bacterium]|jgi:phospholipid/cholesterol/gamma-HCH transport system ATP-binding protein|nr:ATP-binding cassette domain-containing protein [Terriglobales bacterium]
MSTPEAPSHAGAPVVEPAPWEMIIFDNVSLAFEQNRVLEGVSFRLTHGETKILLGVAGTGKTTILKLALGLVKPDSGHIYVLGHDVPAMPEEDLFVLRREMGMVFQESALFDSLTVKENVGYRLIEEGDSEEEVERRVLEALRFVELEGTVDMFPSELSGGMRRRVAIARAVITQPEVLLYDSPTAGLDPITSTTIIELVVKQRDVYHTSALLVTHRLQDAFIMASHCFDKQTNRMRPIEKGERVETNTSFVILRDAKVIFDGTAEELARSRDEYIREYLS